MIRVLLVEDHAIVRKGVYFLLDSQSDIEVVGEASNGHEALAATRELQPDVVVMDINMPELNGLEATRQISKLYPEVKVLVLTMYSNEEYVLQLLQAGAAGYIVKQSIPDELLSAIRAVSNGDAFLSPSVSRNLIDEYLRYAPSESKMEPYDRLTDREREVMQLLVEGYSTKEIGKKLNISGKTVGVHRVNLMEKLEIQTVPDLVKYALRKGMISLD